MEDQTKARKEAPVREGIEETKLEPKRKVTFVALSCHRIVVEPDGDGLYILRFADRHGRSIDPLPLTIEEIEDLGCELRELSNWLKKQHPEELRMWKKEN